MLSEGQNATFHDILSCKQAPLQNEILNNKPVLLPICNLPFQMFLLLSPSHTLRLQFLYQSYPYLYLSFAAYPSPAFHQIYCSSFSDQSVTPSLIFLYKAMSLFFNVMNSFEFTIMGDILFSNLDLLLFIISLTFSFWFANIKISISLSALSSPIAVLPKRIIFFNIFFSFIIISFSSSKLRNILKCFSRGFSVSAE